MDKVFQEEQKKLAEIETQIGAIASRYEQQARTLQSKIKDFYCLDYDDMQQKRELMTRQASAAKSAARFRAYELSPYFGRLDLDTEDSEETETYYIGKEGISDNAKSIVIDWRSQIGECYYISNQKEFRINGINYLLSLRRALDVKNKTLVSYRTEYDGTTVSLEGEVIDPFLLTVLKDKRRQNRLTDIIRTIQGNQNDIIRKPRTESFVVQGCAGSGKTMILLHRLSYLKFNNRNMSLSGVKIITPNKFFDAHINDLSVELGLTAIDRFSVEEYYVSLIKRYSNKVTTDANVCSEKTLSSDLLATIYSLDYLNDSITRYHEYWNQTLKALSESKLRGYFRKFEKEFPDTTLHTEATVARLEQVLQQISSVFSATEKKKQNVAQRLETISREVESIQDELEQSRTSLLNTKSQTVVRLEFDAIGIEQALQELEQKSAELNAGRDELQNRRKQAENDLAQATSALEAFSQGSATYSNYDQFVLLNDAASQIIRVEYASFIQEISDAERAYQRIPVYSFGKRNDLRKQIAKKKEKFALDIAEFVTNQTSNAEQKTSELKATIEALNREINIASESIREIEKNSHSQQAKLTSLRECLNVLNSSVMPDTQNTLTVSTHRAFAQILVTYEEQYDAFNLISRRLASFASKKTDIEREQAQIAQDGYTVEDYTYIAECSKILKKLQLNEITRNVLFKDLLAQYRLHGQKYQNTNYRHKIYLKLLYCALYFARPISQDAFLNIDEAQDISIAEYHLLRMILGNRCIFNLYGDINQSVYSYKGITDWNEIADITSGNIYVLNENYRNTLQITNFCNKEFGAEFLPIGISGEPVEETDTATAIKWILDLKQKNPDYRVAILHRHGLKAVQERLRSLLMWQDVSWYSVDDKKLSVLSVETAKGLEFEAVVAIVDQMSTNEKYISYTRALERLNVVRDEFSSELDVDEATEGIDDEFAFPDEEKTPTSEEQTQTDKELDAILEDALNHNSDSNHHDAQGSSEVMSQHPTGQFFSWEILDEATAVKTCDKSFFEHNGSGVPREISWFFDSGSMQRGDTKKMTLFFGDKSFSGKVAYESSEHSRMRIFWNTELGELLSSYRDRESIRAMFQKLSDDIYRITMIESQDGASALQTNDGVSQKEDLLNHQIPENDSKVPPADELSSDLPDEEPSFSAEEFALLAEFDSILEERFSSEQKLSIWQQSIVAELYRGKFVACNAPSGSMKSVMLYLLALKEHQTSGKQTLLTAEAHLQENELFLADKLGLRSSNILTMVDFLKDAKKEKYDVIFVPYDFFKQPENIRPFIDYFTDKVAYWGLDHPASEQSLWAQLSSCRDALDAVMFLMAKSGFSDLDLSDYRRIDISDTTDIGMVKKHTLLSAEEKLKWLLENLGELNGQGLIYCNDEATCKMLVRYLRKSKTKAEAYIDVANPDKRESINYLTNSFSKGSMPILVTTQEAGKNLSNPHIRFVIHYDVPDSEELHQLHVTQIGQLSANPVVHDLHSI